MLEELRKKPDNPLINHLKILTMKKLFLILIVMVAFATTSSYAYSDNYRAWVASESGYASETVTLPSGYGWTSIQFVMYASSYGDYVQVYSAGGSDICYGPYGNEYPNFPYYAGTTMTLTAYAGYSDYSFAQISAYYIK